MGYTDRHLLLLAITIEVTSCHVEHTNFDLIFSCRLTSLVSCFVYAMLVLIKHCTKIRCLSLVLSGVTEGGGGPP